MQTTTRRPNHKYARVNTKEDDEYYDTTYDGTHPNLSNVAGGGTQGESRAKEWSHRINNLIHSCFWIGLAIFVIQYCDLIRVLRIDERVFKPFLYLSCISWFGVISMFIYLGLWLPLIKKQRIEDYNVTHSNHIKITLVLTGITLISFIISIWNVWRWISIPITLSLLMGCMMVPNILPSF